VAPISHNRCIVGWSSISPTIVSAMPKSVMVQIIEAEARLRPKNQLTLPEPIAAALDARANDLLVFEVDPSEPSTARVKLVRGSFAGALTGVYGTTEDVRRFLREERAAWGE